MLQVLVRVTSYVPYVLRREELETLMLQLLGKDMSCGENIMQDLSSRSLQNSVRHLAKSLEEALNALLPQSSPPFRRCIIIHSRLEAPGTVTFLQPVIVMIVVIILFIT